MLWLKKVENLWWLSYSSKDCGEDSNMVKTFEYKMSISDLNKFLFEVSNLIIISE